MHRSDTPSPLTPHPRARRPAPGGIEFPISDGYVLVPVPHNDTVIVHVVGFCECSADRLVHVAQIAL